MKTRILITIFAPIALGLAGCSDQSTADALAGDTPSETAASEEAMAPVQTKDDGRAAVRAAGQMIGIETPKGKFHVWTRKVGDNPSIKVLLLHGGPGSTHEYLKIFEQHFLGAGIEFYYYDQLGSYYSDQPTEPSLWTIDRFVDEVEQVRQALGLGPDNFYLYGHSWGGVLGLEYALKYQNNLKGLIISDMMASGPAYNAYVHDVLMPQIDPEVLAELQEFEAAGDYGNPRYIQLLRDNYFVRHGFLRPREEWPEEALRGAAHFNPQISLPLQGPTELGIGGVLATWDVSNELHNITVPTLMIGATHDTMDPKYMRWMSEQVTDGRFLLCPDSGHMPMYDDEEVYFDGLIQFLKDVDSGAFPPKD